MPTMREDARTTDNYELVDAVGYHDSEFKSLKYYDSDRNRPLKDILIPRAFGLEIETESKILSDLTAYAEVLMKICTMNLPEDFFRVEEDGSLGHGGQGVYGAPYHGYAHGLEMPTQIMTKQRMRNEYRNFKLMYDVWFPRFGISCYEGKSCGMHVNISNGFFGKTKEKQYEAIKKLIYFVNKNYDLCCKLFYRRKELTHWCGKMPNCDNMDYVRNQLNLEHMYNDHGACINGVHIRERISSARVELRLVGGQKNYYSFRNTMESVFFLCERVKSIAWKDIDDMEKFFKGCNQYVVKRLDDVLADNLISLDTYNSIKDNSIFENLEIR